MSDSDAKTMTCMEVWGGSEVVDNAVSMNGLDAWVYSKPYQSAEAGGDVYYVSSCATGRITRLLVADVSGHGAKVRDTAAALRGLMRRYVNHLDQRQFLRSMNTHFTEISEAGIFATAVVTTFFGPTRYLTLCNAGHPTPLIYRAKQKQWTLLERQPTTSEEMVNIPLGIEGMTEYGQVGLQLHPDDLVLCYSDSLIEACGDDRVMLGEAGLLEIARTLDVKDPARLVPQLLDKISQRTSKPIDGDDVTVLLFRPTGGRGSAHFFLRAFAPIRVLGATIRACFPGGQSAPLPDFKIANVGGAMFSSFNRFWRGQ
jgi:sigma-B regulation protein RsbU (phosphoserine phosphatase)